MEDKFVNRKTEPLPTEECNIKAMVYDESGEAIIHICVWKPFISEDYPSNRMPSLGYLGTAKVLEGEFEGLGFHCWCHMDSDFLYYSLIENDTD